MSSQITSLQNKRIKGIVKLRQRRQRDAQQLTVAEGVREAELALRSGIVPREAYLCPELLEHASASHVLAQLELLAQNGSTQLFNVPAEVFLKIAYRGESGGLLLIIPYLHTTLEALSLGNPPFLAVVEDAEKPGNLGAILRTADAAGVDGIIICSQDAAGGTDIHNPNVIRASLGTLFTVPVAVAATGQVIEWLKQQGIRTLAATPDASALYTEVDMSGPVALIMGSEAHGLGLEWMKRADEQVLIPMKGAVDSLNLSVSTALLLYEVVRQRSSSSRKIAR